MYQKIPVEWLDLMKRLLEKDPKRRINATESLAHEFFSEDSKVHETLKNRDSLNITIP
jgi:serine/threonine protein kinase